MPLQPVKKGFLTLAALEALADDATVRGWLRLGIRGIRPVEVGQMYVLSSTREKKVSETT